MQDPINEVPTGRVSIRQVEYPNSTRITTFSSVKHTSEEFMVINRPKLKLWINHCLRDKDIQCLQYTGTEITPHDHSTLDMSSHRDLFPNKSSWRLQWPENSIPYIRNDTTGDIRYLEYSGIHERMIVNM